MNNYKKIYDFVYNKGYHSDLSFNNSEFLIGKICKKIGKDKRILDLGCSNGSALKFLKEKGYDVFGIDIAFDALKLAKKNNINGVVASIIDLPVKENYFDVVYSTDVLEHLYPDHVKGCINEIRRVCKDRFFLKVYLEKEKNQTYINLIKKEKVLDIDNLHLTTWDYKKWIKVLKNCGFVEEENFVKKPNRFESVFKKV